MPLHIFEPRYRRMVAHCMGGTRRFGMVYVADSGAEAPTSGSVGCVALIDATEKLPDGRSNITVIGQDRFEIDRFTASDEPFLIALIREYHDLPAPVSKAGALPVAQVRSLFDRVARAVRDISGEEQTIPPLPDNPSDLSFAIAAMLDLEGDARQELLETRSVAERLILLERILSAALPAIEERAAVHTRAKSNGSGLHAH